MEVKIDTIKVSSNKIYAGCHWRTRAKLKGDYLLITKAPFKALTPVEGKVDISFTFFFTGRALDSSNCSYMAKMLEDCLVSYGVLKNDTIEFVGKVSMEAVKIKEKVNDYCVIKITNIT